MRFLGLFLVVLSLFFLVPTVYSADLTPSLIRIDKLKAGSALSGMVCASPASPATEAKVQIAFPSDFNISSSGWSTGTSQILSTATAWPGISFQSVSGNTVTFASGDLTPGTMYCFTFTASGSFTGSSGQKNGTITTFTASSTPIDTREYVITIYPNGTVAVSGTVPAVPTDFTATLTQIDPAGTTIEPGTELTYQLNYSSGLSYPTTVQIVASWSQGTIGTSLIPTLDVLDYMVGTASKGYNNTIPVIDTVSRTITWNISPCPGNLNNTVTFKLKTNRAYTGADTVSFTVSGKVLGPGVESASSDINDFYVYKAPRSSSSGTSGSSSSSGSTGTTTTTTTTPSTPQPASFNQVGLTTLNATGSSIQIGFSSPVQATIYYGTGISSLSKSVTLLNLTTLPDFTLNDLLPDTIYYFKVIGKNASGTATSDVFTFKTPKSSSHAAEKINPNSIVMESNSIILADPLSFQEQPNQVAIVPADSPLQLKFRIDQAIDIKKIQLFLQNQNVLGIATAYAQSAGNNTNMVEIKKGEFTGRIYAGTTPGTYSLIARIFDTTGNISEQKIITIKVTPKMKVTDRAGDPIESAKLELSYFNETEKRFLPVSTQGLSLNNPNYSDYKGEFLITLPSGMYRAHVAALGYAPQDLDFTIGKDSKYPTFSLEKTGFSLSNTGSYYYESFSDLLSSFIASFVPLAHSYRFVDAVALVTLTILILLSFVGFTSKTQLKPKAFAYFILFHLPFIPLKKGTVALQGRVIGQDKTPLNGVAVSFLDHEKNVLYTTTTNKKGIFYYAASPKHVYMSLLKPGFEEYQEDLMIIHKKPIEIALVRQENFIAASKRSVGGIFDFLFSLLFEFLLFTSFVLEILFFFIWSPYKILPFLGLSILNMMLYAFYRKSHKVFTN
ncbi:MAG: fibronectin type III domain-containing protein [Candidatus Levyibacteriota bacterium]